MSFPKKNKVSNQKKKDSAFKTFRLKKDPDGIIPTDKASVHRINEFTNCDGLLGIDPSTKER